ncbi:hypothetical protein ES703_81709 [subsurface metagenome]
MSGLIKKDNNTEVDLKSLQEIEEFEVKMKEMGYSKGLFLKFLETETGRQIANEVVKFLNSYQKKSAKLEWAKIVIIALIIVATGLLTYFDKFDASLGVLLGTLAGYLFGKKDS